MMLNDDLIFPMDCQSQRNARPSDPMLIPVRQVRAPGSFEDRYELVAVPGARGLANGEHSTVSYALNKATGQPVCIKTFDALNTRRARVSYNVGLQVPNVGTCPLRLEQDYSTHATRVIVPYQAGEAPTRHNLAGGARMQVCVDIVNALDAMHKAGYAHNAIHRGNIMVHQGRGFLVGLSSASEVTPEGRKKDFAALCHTLLAEVGVGDAASDRVRALSRQIEIMKDPTELTEADYQTRLMHPFMGVQILPPAGGMAKVVQESRILFGATFTPPQPVQSIRLA